MSSVSGGSFCQREFIPSITSANSTKSKLALVQEKINTFEQQMVNEAKQRRATDEERISSIRDSLAKFEKTLNGEIRKRHHATTALQNTFEQQIQVVQEKLESIFVSKLNDFQVAVDALSERICSVENEFISEKEKYVKEIEHKNIFISKELASLQREFEGEKIERQKKESTILTRLDEFERKSENDFAQEQILREKYYEELSSDLNDAKQIREDTDNNFQDFLIAEISKIKDDLVVESKCREAADDDIVQAVNHYTKALQDSVRLLNSS